MGGSSAIDQDRPRNTVDSNRAKRMNRGDGVPSEATRVTIFGRDYQLHSDESPDYTNKVADLVDRKMAEIASERNLADPARVAIMAAMEIADDLLTQRAQGGRERGKAAEALGKLERVLDGVGRG